jgi:Flp pilus assembly protein TadG
MNRKKRNLKTRNRRGAIIVLFAILLPILLVILLVILGFAVDYAYMQKTRNEARVIADLGAKAAADTLARTDGDVAAAIASAKLIASTNYVAGEHLTLTDDQISFGRATQAGDGSYQIIDGQTPYNSVTVRAERTNGSADGPGRLFFGQLRGSPTFETIQQASSSFRDVEIMLVLDRSASMKYEITGILTDAQRLERRCQTPLPTSRWAALDEAVKTFLRELDASQVQEKVGLVTFASTLTSSCKPGEEIVILESSLDSPLNPDLNFVRSEMDRLGSEIWLGATNIRAGIREARIHFEANGTENVEKIIVCLTDGVHNVDEGPMVEAELCKAQGIKIHTITFSERADKEGMTAIADATGGSQSHADDAETLALIFKRLGGAFAILTK